jgi:hypothetical protein
VVGLGWLFMVATPIYEGWKWWIFLPIFGIPASWWLSSRAQRYFYLKDFEAWQAE